MIKFCDCTNKPCRDPETEQCIRALRERHGFCPDCGEIKRETVENASYNKQGDRPPSGKHLTPIPCHGHGHSVAPLQPDRPT
jgi:hypothetical protein